MRLGLLAERLLLGCLILTVLPPLLQLEINELPHHPGLSQADRCQARHPKGGKVDEICFFSLKKALSLHLPNGEHVEVAVR